ncbi:MAG: A/G-specific adenine glycosylase [Acidobacteriota bacterium]|nr:A/G-specific adenine glycosylase [Acidobacteriota bacterium]
MSRDAARQLLSWYDDHRRDLPWRKNTDPYRVWVSEIMLQQTRVETVIPYYEAFLERFPSVEALARAQQEEVLARWSGLGYYRRARQLHAAAQAVVERGGFPENAEGLQELPGIGAYTSAAVASIAFGQAVPVMDGNVERVTSRLLASEANPKRSAQRRRLVAQAAELLDAERPGDSNQALMELGATVCTPTAPACGRCPLASECRGFASGDPERYPEPRQRRAPVRLFRRVALVIEAEEEPAPQGRELLLLFRRPDDSEVLAGTWELPSVEGPREEFLVSEEESLAKSQEAFAARYGGRWRLAERRGTVRHSITHRAYTLEVWSARVEASGELAEGPEAGFFSAAELGELPLSSQVRKILAQARWPE